MKDSIDLHEEECDEGTNDATRHDVRCGYGDDNDGLFILPCVQPFIRPFVRPLHLSKASSPSVHNTYYRANIEPTDMMDS